MPSFFFRPLVKGSDKMHDLALIISADDQHYYISKCEFLSVKQSLIARWCSTMPINKIALEKAVKRAFPVTHLEIHDVSSGCGENYSIVLVSEVRANSCFP